MKALYNFVTFLAAVVILGWAGWCVYTHWDILVKQVTKPAHCKPCCAECTCNKANCKTVDGKKCCADCGCDQPGCCK